MYSRDEDWGSIACCLTVSYPNPKLPTIDAFAAVTEPAMPIDEATNTNIVSENILWEDLMKSRKPLRSLHPMTAVTSQVLNCL